LPEYRAFCSLSVDVLRFALAAYESSAAGGMGINSAQLT
jgi:hypothetical protein